MSKQELKQKGFTIIEVVLVLAIAALIFLMVFIALPALQRSQRDNARKNDVSIVSGAITSFAGNNRSGSVPTDAQLKQYATDLSGNSSAPKVQTALTGDKSIGDGVLKDGEILVYPNAKCGTVGALGNVELTKGTSRQYAIVTVLESGNNSGFCLDS
jgi:prepilin-type N-terminal cleavage/methylation domain-containing protein